jgi:hypothetical protein
MITKKNLYTIAFVALGLIGIISIYYLSRKSECCGSCHIASAEHADTHDHDNDDANGAEHIAINETE